MLSTGEACSLGGPGPLMIEQEVGKEDRLASLRGPGRTYG
jgi:hypothetical protein